MMKLILYFSLIYQSTRLTQGFIALDAMQNLFFSPPGCLACYGDEANNYFTNLNRLSPFCADKEIDVFRKIPKMVILAHICIYQTGTEFQPKYDRLQFQGNMILKKFQNCFKKNPLNQIGRKMLKDATILFEQGRKRCQNGGYLEGGLKGIRKLYPLPTPKLFKIPKKITKPAYKKPKIHSKDKTETSVKYSTGVAKKQKKSTTKAFPLSNTLPSENSSMDQESESLDENNVSFDTNDFKKIFNSEDSSVDEAQDKGINLDSVSTSITDSEMSENQYTSSTTDAYEDQIKNNDILDDIPIPIEDLEPTNDQSEITLAPTDIATKEKNLQDSFENQFEPLENDEVQENPIAESNQSINDVVEENTMLDLDPSTNNRVQEDLISKSDQLINDIIETNTTVDSELSVNDEVQKNPILGAQGVTNDAVEEDTTSDAEPQFVNDMVEENSFVNPEPSTKAAVEEDITLGTESPLINDVDEEPPIQESGPIVNDEAGENLNADTKPLTNDEVEKNDILSSEPFENNTQVEPIINDIIDENIIAEPNESSYLAADTSLTVQEDSKILDNQSELMPKNSFLSEAQDDEIDPNFSENQSEPLVNETVIDNSLQLQDNGIVSQDDPTLSLNNTSKNEDQITSSTSSIQPLVDENSPLVPLEETFIAAPVGTSKTNSLESPTEDVIVSPNDPIVESLPDFQDNTILDGLNSSSNIEDPIIKSEDEIITEIDNTSSINEVLGESSKVSPINVNASTKINEVLEENSKVSPIDVNTSTKVFELTSEDQSTPLVNNSPEELLIPNNPPMKDDSISLQNDTSSNNLENTKLEEEILPQVTDSHVKDLNLSQKVDPLTENSLAILQTEVKSEDDQGETVIPQKRTRRPPFKKVKGKKTGKKTPKHSSSLVEQIPSERTAPTAIDSNQNKLNQNQKDDLIIEDNSSQLPDIKSEEKPTLTSNDPFVKASEPQINENIALPINDSIVEDSKQIQKDATNIGNISTLPTSEIQLENEPAPQNINNLLPNSKEVKSEEEITPQHEIKLEDDPFTQTTNNLVLDNYSSGVKPDEKIVEQSTNTQSNENKNTPSSTETKLEDGSMPNTSENSTLEKSEENIIPQTFDSPVEEPNQIQENVPITDDGPALKTTDASVSQDLIVSNKFTENITPDSSVPQQNQTPITENNSTLQSLDVEPAPQPIDAFVSQDFTLSDKSEDNVIQQATDSIIEKKNEILVPISENNSTPSSPEVEPAPQITDALVLPGSTPSDKSEENIIPQTADSLIENQNQIQENVSIIEDNSIPSQLNDGPIPQTTDVFVSQESIPSDKSEENIIPQITESLTGDHNHTPKNIPNTEDNSIPSSLENGSVPQTTDALVSQDSTSSDKSKENILKNQIQENVPITEDNSMLSLLKDEIVPQTIDTLVSQDLRISDQSEENITPETTDSLVEDQNKIQYNVPIIIKDTSIPSSQEDGLTPQPTDASISQDSTLSDKSEENITPQTTNSPVEDQNQIQEKATVLSNPTPSSTDNESTPPTTEATILEDSKLSSNVDSINKDTSTLPSTDIPTKTSSEIEENILTPEIISETKPINNSTTKDISPQTSEELINSDTIPTELSSKVQKNQEPQADSLNDPASKNEKNSLSDDQTLMTTLSSGNQPTTTQDDASQEKSPEPLQQDPKLTLDENPTNVDNIKVDDTVSNESDVNSISTEQQNNPQNKTVDKPKETEKVTKEYKKMMNDLQLNDTEKLTNSKNEIHNDFKKRYEDNPYIF